MIGISAVEDCRKVVGRRRRPLRVGNKGRHGCRNVKVMTVPPFYGETSRRAKEVSCSPRESLFRKGKRK